MNFLRLAYTLLPLAEEVFRSIEDAIRAGKSQDDIHQTIVDHAVELPAKIRNV